LWPRSVSSRAICHPMKPEAPVTNVGFTDGTDKQAEGLFYRKAHDSILKLSASLALMPSAADGS
jgi:hypothetical protein